MRLTFLWRARYELLPHLLPGGRCRHGPIRDRPIEPAHLDSRRRVVHHPKTGIDGFCAGGQKRSRKADHALAAHAFAQSAFTGGLCDEQASRYSVRQALQELQDLGLISRRKNVGTRVEAIRAAAGFTQSIATVDELAQFGAAHVRIVHSVEPVVVDLSLAKEMGCAGGSLWLRISSLRMEDDKRGRPMCWTDVYLDPDYADIADLVRAAPRTLISSLIEERYGRRIARIRQDVCAIVLPPSLAEVLKAEAGAAALQLIRHYVDGRGPDDDPADDHERRQGPAEAAAIAHFVRGAVQRSRRRGHVRLGSIHDAWLLCRCHA